MAERGRVAGFQMGAEHRSKISNSRILSDLIQAAQGEIEMTPVRANIAIALLKKVMPDLSAITLSGDAANPIALKQIELTIVKAQPGSS